MISRSREVMKQAWLAFAEAIGSNVGNLCMRTRKWSESFQIIIFDFPSSIWHNTENLRKFIERLNDCLKEEVKHFARHTKGDIKQFQDSTEFLWTCFTKAAEALCSMRKKYVRFCCRYIKKLSELCRGISNTGKTTSSKYCRTVLTRKATFITPAFMLLVGGYVYFVTLFTLLDPSFKPFGFENFFDIADYTSIAAHKFWVIFVVPIIIMMISAAILLAVTRFLSGVLRIIFAVASAIFLAIACFFAIIGIGIVAALGFVFFAVAIVFIVGRLVITVACIFALLIAAALYGYILFIVCAARAMVEFSRQAIEHQCEEAAQRKPRQPLGLSEEMIDSSFIVTATGRAARFIVGLVFSPIFVLLALFFLVIFAPLTLVFFVIFALSFLVAYVILLATLALFRMFDRRTYSTSDASHDEHPHGGQSNLGKRGDGQNSASLFARICRAIKRLRKKKDSKVQSSNSSGNCQSFHDNSGSVWINVSLVLIQLLVASSFLYASFSGLPESETYKAFLGDDIWPFSMNSHAASFIVLAIIAAVFIMVPRLFGGEKGNGRPHEKHGDEGPDGQEKGTGCPKQKKDGRSPYHAMLATLVFFGLYYPLMQAQSHVKEIDSKIFGDEGTCAQDPKPEQACSPNHAIDFIREGNKHLSCHRFVIASSRYVFMYSRESEPKISAVPVSGVLNFSWETSEKNKGAAAHKAERCGQEPPAIPGTCFDCLPISTLDNGPEKGMESYTHLCRQDSACLSGNNQVRIVSTEKPKQEEEVLPICCPTEDMCKTELSCISDHSIEIKDPVLNMYFVPDKDEGGRPCPDCPPNGPPPNGPKDPSGKGAPALKMHFELGKDQVSGKCVEELRKIQDSVWEMAQDSGNKSPIKIRFEGRADSRGAADYNLKLSERRVDNAIKSFLCQVGAKNGTNQCANYNSKKNKKTFPCPTGNGQVDGKIDECFSIERVIHGESISGHDFHAQEEHRSVTITIPGMKEAKEISCKNSSANKDQSHRD